MLTEFGLAKMSDPPIVDEPQQRGTDSPQTPLLPPVLASPSQDPNLEPGPCGAGSRLGTYTMESPPAQPPPKRPRTGEGTVVRRSTIPQEVSGRGPASAGFSFHLPPNVSAFLTVSELPGLAPLPPVSPVTGGLANKLDHGVLDAESGH